MGILKELHQRNVFRVGVAYVVTAWLSLQVVDIVFEAIAAPEWVMQGFLSLAALGFVPALLFAWAFEVTPEGIKHESEVDRSQSISDVTGRKLDIMIIVMLVVIGVYVFWEQRIREAEQGTETPAAATAEEPAAAPAEKAPPLAREKSIAVLPFVNLSSDPEQEYFSDGISEELLNVLAQIPQLRVAARTSSFQFKGENRDIREIARLLKVNHVLEGSVRKAGTRLRITAQLIEAENGYHLWSQTYDRELKDVFAIQEEIAAAIGDALRAQLDIKDGALQAAVPRVAKTANTAAYEAYLKGRYLVNQRGNRAITEAERELQKAIRLDPNYAPAQAQLAIAISLLHNSPSSYGDLTAAQVNTRATPHIEAAMALNPALPEVWGAKAILASTNEDSAAALAYATRAIELSPVYIDALNWLNTNALLLGRYRESQESVQRMIEADPLSVIGQLNYAPSLATTNPEEARRIAIQLTNQHKWAGYVVHSTISSSQGEITKSIEWLLRSFAEDPLDRFSNEAMAYSFAMVGLYPEAMRISDATKFAAEYGAGRFQEAADRVRQDLSLEPDSAYYRLILADALYFLGDFEASATVYGELLAGEDGRPIQGNGYNMEPSLRYAWILRSLGREQEAVKLLQLVDGDFAAKRGTSFEDNIDRQTDGALRAWLDGDRAETLALLHKVIDMGGRSSTLSMEPLWGELAGDPEFVSLMSEMENLISVERIKTIDLICNRNPIPDSWQPLTTTCTP